MHILSEGDWAGMHKDRNIQIYVRHKPVLLPDSKQRPTCIFNVKQDEQQKQTFWTDFQPPVQIKQTEWTCCSFFQFLRLSCDTPAQIVYTLFTNHWGLPAPNLVVSVVGGEGHDTIKPWVRDILRNGLVKAAETTGEGLQELQQSGRLSAASAPELGLIKSERRLIKYVWGESWNRKICL